MHIRLNLYSSYSNSDLCNFDHIAAIKKHFVHDIYIMFVYYHAAANKFLHICLIIYIKTFTQSLLLYIYVHFLLYYYIPLLYYC